MEKVVFTTNPTDAALVAVIDALFVAHLIVQVADVTEVKCEILVTTGACPAFGLLKTAAEAFHMRDSFTVELMVLFRVEFLVIAHFIMTEPAWPIFTFAYRVWTLFVTSPFVVLTS